MRAIKFFGENNEIPLARAVESGRVPEGAAGTAGWRTAQGSAALPTPARGAGAVARTPMSLQLLEPSLRTPPPAPGLPSPPIGEGSPLRSPCPSVSPRSLCVGVGAASPAPCAPSVAGLCPGGGSGRACPSAPRAAKLARQRAAGVLPGSACLALPPSPLRCVSLHERLVRAWEAALPSRSGWRALVWLATNLLGFDQRGKVL